MRRGRGTHQLRIQRSKIGANLVELFVDERLDADATLRLALFPVDGRINEGAKVAKVSLFERVEELGARQLQRRIEHVIITRPMACTCS
jgi:hypothetical protein